MILSLIIFCPKTLSMIVPSEINENDIVKILVNEDGLEDQMYGVVGMNTGLTLGIKYLNPTDIIYKSACVYKLNQDELSPAPYESVMEHYPSGTTFEDLEMKNVGTDLFAFYSEIDLDDTDSEMYEEGNTSSEMGSFIVSDNEVDMGQPPPDYASIDHGWSGWNPSTSGGKSFKETVDLIESKIRDLSK